MTRLEAVTKIVKAGKPHAIHEAAYAMGVEVFMRGPFSFSPIGPTGCPSRETFSTESKAKIEALKWAVSYWNAE